MAHPPTPLSPSNHTNHSNHSSDASSTKEELSPHPPDTATHPELSSNESIIRRSGSMSSISSASSYNTFGTNQRNEEEIFENVQSLSHIIHEPPPLLSAAAISPSPKRISPTSSPSHRRNHSHNDNSSNSMCAHEPILSALTTFYGTHNSAHSPREDDTLYLDTNQDPQSVQSAQSDPHQDLHQNTNHNIDSHAVNHYTTREEEEEEEKKEEHVSNNNNNNNDDDRNESVRSLHDILSTPHFMDHAITMYGHLDDALTNINSLKSHQLEQMKSLRRRKKRKRRKIYANISSEYENEDNATEEPPLEEENETMEEIDVNERVVFTMQTLISSTTQMGSFFASSSSKPSIFGVLFDKLSSSIAYMSYISVSTVTPFIYNIVEAVLLELYATIKDIIEYYDPDPKNNVLWRIIDKMNEIIEAIHGLLALSDCFYEISSDDNAEEEEEYEPERDQDASHSFFKEIEKEKQD